MVYQINTYRNRPTFYVDQTTYDANPSYKLGFLFVGTQADAEKKLAEEQENLFNLEAAHFIVQADFIDGTNTTRREVLDTDQENIVCYVPDYLNHTHIEVVGKTQGIALNKQKKQEFLAIYKLDKVYELDTLPVEQIYSQAIYGTTTGSIPVEVM